MSYILEQILNISYIATVVKGTLETSDCDFNCEKWPTSDMSIQIQCQNNQCLHSTSFSCLFTHPNTKGPHFLEELRP